MQLEMGGLIICSPSGIRRARPRHILSKSSEPTEIACGQRPKNDGNQGSQRLHKSVAIPICSGDAGIARKLNFSLMRDDLHRQRQYNATAVAERSILKRPSGRER
jgi:hypothetical protein